jgi:serine protease AprX
MAARQQPHRGSRHGRNVRTLGLVLPLLLGVVAGAGRPAVTPPLHAVVVVAVPGAVPAAEAAVARHGGDVARSLDVIDGFSAQVPTSALAGLAADPAVRSVGPDRRLQLLHAVDGYDGSEDPGSLWSTRRALGTRDWWSDGLTGQGVDVALIDSGVAPVEGLTLPGKVVHGPDLSFEAQDDTLRTLDTYGHGTHLAGIIAGRDADAPTDGRYGGEHDRFLGIAPGARVVSLKVADASGATDVSQVIAAIDWVVQHRRDPGMNIRVLNLAFGTDSARPYADDPLAHAVEVAWRKGIVVVVAAGNDGTSLGRLRDPAYHPAVLAVGADVTQGTPSVDDDTIPAFSSRGDGVRNPDLVAPGRSLVSLRVPGSGIDEAYPQGRVNTRLFRGSGTSQAAAVASGAVALLLQQRPDLTPDQVKALLTGTAQPVPGADARAQGRGLLSMGRVRGTATPTVGAATPEEEDESAGTEETWNGSSWSGSSWSGSSWSGSSWSGSSWSGSSWSGSSWSASNWS